MSRPFAGLRSSTPQLVHLPAVANTLHGWKTVIFLIDLIFDWICWFIEKSPHPVARLLVWLFKALDPLCAIVRNIFKFLNIWILSIKLSTLHSFFLLFRHCWLDSQIRFYFFSTFQYPMWLHRCIQAISSLSILWKLLPVAVLKSCTGCIAAPSSVSILFCWTFLK